MNALKVAIVEDDFIISQDINANLIDLGYEVTGIYESGAQAIAGVKENRPDIILMDINIEGKLDGIETIKVINEDCDVPFIYVTGYSDNSTLERAKKTQPHAYIVKPFNFSNIGPTLEMAVYNFSEGLKSSIEEAREPLKTNYQEIIAGDTVFLKEKKRMVKVVTNDIQYLNANGSYCRIYTEDKEFTISHNLQYVLDKLNSGLFQRIHRSYAVNINSIEAIEEDLLFINKQTLPLSRTYRAELLDKINSI